MAATETAADVFAATGDVIVAGALAVTEPADTFAAVGQSYTANPVNFDGTNDYLSKTSALAGVANSKSCHCSQPVAPLVLARPRYNIASMNVMKTVSSSYRARDLPISYRLHVAENAATNPSCG